MTPPTIDQLMQELQERLPHLTHAEREVVRMILVKARVSLTVYQVEKKVQSEEAKAA